MEPGAAWPPRPAVPQHPEGARPPPGRPGFPTPIQTHLASVTPACSFCYFPRRCPPWGNPIMVLKDLMQRGTEGV